MHTSGTERILVSPSRDPNIYIKINVLLQILTSGKKYREKNEDLKNKRTRPIVLCSFLGVLILYRSSNIPRHSLYPHEWKLAFQNHEFLLWRLWMYLKSINTILRICISWSFPQKSLIHLTVEIIFSTYNSEKRFYPRLGICTIIFWKLKKKSS